MSVESEGPGIGARRSRRAAPGSPGGDTRDGNAATTSSTGTSAKGAAAQQDKPSCFVIGPIGRDDSEARKRSDQLLRHIIEPIIMGLGYERPLRADRIGESGRITRQIIQHIVEDDLVVADLTDSNPNVYYELALRHAIKKPFVQILAGQDSLPFDVADQRTIMVDHRDLDSVAKAKDDLTRQVEAIQAGTDIDTPLTFAIDVASLKSSENPGDRTQGEILQLLEEVRNSSRITARAVRRNDDAADLALLRQFVETVTTEGNVVDQDVENLVDPWSSPGHARWVNSVRKNMNPFLPVRRDPDLSKAVLDLPPALPEEPPF
jgi:hypothetical protein